MNPLITPTEAEALVCSQLPDLGTEEISLAEATGRVLASPLVADRPLPPYDRVMMDGICFRFSDATGGPLAIHGLHPAGATAPAPLPTGHCWEVMTGACLPPDCDTVVPYEAIERHGEDAVTFSAETAEAGRHIHRTASDFAAGAVLVPTDTRVDARVASVAATIGASALTVHRRPRVAILSTGDEVVPVEATPASHQVRRSNAPALAAALARLDAELISTEHIIDDEEATRTAVERSLDADLVLLCGGISKGKRDFVRPVVEKLAGPPAFHGVAQRPGKPLAFWPAGKTPIIAALPGNPMSVLVCFHRYIRPLLDRLAHQAPPARTVQLAAPVTFAPPMAWFLPVALRQDGATVLAESRPLANSGDFASSIGTDGFLELPAGETDFPEGFLAPFHEWI